jgi:putative RNA 2'-phosphotransferase
MNEKELKNHSKFLSLILRHRPEVISVRLDENGWTDVETLIAQANRNGKDWSMELLELIVKNNNKNRFTFNDDKTQIRANQGHSVKVDLGFEPKQPPRILFHGTAEKYVESIEKTGLIKKNRNHVHLSLDVDTAANVGQRHGKPVIFEIDAEAMSRDGYAFYLSQNGVWLTDAVPVQYMKRSGLF